MVRLVEAIPCTPSRRAARPAAQPPERATGGGGASSHEHPCEVPSLILECAARARARGSVSRRPWQRPARGGSPAPASGRRFFARLRPPRSLRSRCSHRSPPGVAERRPSAPDRRRSGRGRGEVRRPAAKMALARDAGYRAIVIAPSGRRRSDPVADGARCAAGGERRGTRRRHSPDRGRRPLQRGDPDDRCGARAVRRLRRVDPPLAPCRAGRDRRQRAQPEPVLAAAVRAGRRGHRSERRTSPPGGDLRRAETRQAVGQRDRRRPVGPRQRPSRGHAADPLADPFHRGSRHRVSRSGGTGR